MRYVVALTLGLAGVVPLAGQERAIDNFAGLGVRAMGMGGAYAGVADDFTAVFWNPAGLAQMRQRQVYTAFLRNDYDTEAVVGGTRTTTGLTNTRFGSFGVVVPYPVYRGSLVFAAGFNRVKDLDSAVRVRGFSRADSLLLDNSFRHEGELTATSLAGAVEVSPEISLGLALHLWGGDDQNGNDISQVDVDTLDYFTGIRQATQDLYEDDHGGWNATLGLMISSSRERPKMRLGLTASSGVTHEIRYRFTGVLPPDWVLAEYEPDRVIIEGMGMSGDVPVEDRIALIPDWEEIVDQGTAGGNPYVRTDAGRTITKMAISDADTVVVVEVEPQELSDSFKLTLPLEFGIGLSYRPVPSLLLAGSVHLAEWSQAEYRERDTDDLRTYLTFEEEYRDAVRYHLGAEWQVPVIALDLRAGYYSDPLPFVGQELAGDGAGHEITIEQDRSFWTVGAGMLFDQVLQLDVALTRGGFEEIRGDSREDSSLNRFLASAAYHF